MREGCGVGDIGALFGGGGTLGFAPPPGAVGGGLSVAFHLAPAHKESDTPHFDVHRATIYRALKDG